MKTVTFKDQEFEVCGWAQFIAADPDGRVYAFENLPHKRGDGTYDSHGQYESVGLLDDPNCQQIL